MPSGCRVNGHGKSTEKLSQTTAPYKEQTLNEMIRIVEWWEKGESMRRWVLDMHWNEMHETKV